MGHPSRHLKICPLFLDNAWVTMTRILVIEDDVNVSDILQEMLRQEGFEVFASANGRQGVTFAQDCLPDLILCDVMMPELDGYGVLQLLQDNPQTACIPLIFLTAKTSYASIRQGMELGAADYLTKPFQRHELLKAVSVQLQKRHIFQQDKQQQLDDLRRSLMTALPHELRTPLQGILTSAELLNAYWEDLGQEEIRDIASNIHLSAERLYELIQKFLLYTKLTFAHEVKDVDGEYGHWSSASQGTIALLAQEVAARYRRSPDLSCSLGEGAVALSEKWLMTLMKEVIDNAFKFSDCGTQVVITSEVKEPYLWLQVKNYGRGMTAAQIQGLGACVQFDRNHYEQQGIGLGLAIVAQLVTLCQGKLRVESVPQETTVIHVALPLAKGDPLAWFESGGGLSS